MNSQPFKNVKNYESHLSWLESELQNSSKTSSKISSNTSSNTPSNISPNSSHDPSTSNTIVFMHIPPFVKTPDESDRWDNLPKSTRFSILNLFDKYKAKYVFTGHCHRQVGSQALDYNGVQILPVQACSVNLDVQTILGRFVGCKVNQDELGWLQVFIRGVC